MWHHREGPDPAVDDRRGRVLRPASRLRTPAGTHRPGDVPDPALSPARAVAAVPGRSAALVGRVDLRPRLPPPPHAAAGARLRADAARRVAADGVGRFDRARPLWEFTLIEGLYDADGTERAAFAMKVHHTVTDGVGGMELLALLVDLTADATEPADTPAAPAPEIMDARALMRESLVHSARRMLGVARRLPGTVVTRRPRRCAIRCTRAASSRAPPARSAGSSHRPRSRCRRSCAIAGSAGVSTCSTSRSTTSAGRPKPPKAASTTCSSPRSSGGLYRYHERHGDCPDSLRMTLPINLRREGDDSGRQSLRARALRGAGDDRRLRASACRRSARSCSNGGPSRRCS